MYAFKSFEAAPSSAPGQGPARGGRTLLFPLAYQAAAEHYREIAVEFDAETKTFWCYQEPRGAPSYTPPLLRDLAKMQASIKSLYARFAREGEQPIRYFVVASRPTEIFNLGGDLRLIAGLVRTRNRFGLERYARHCIDVLYNNAIGYGLPIITIALVQGDALGGGFESALSCNVIVAERSTKFGLPEILFNLFPGMGAYSLLARRLDAVRAEKLILSGRVYSGAELHEMGVVDVLAEDGCGEEAVRQFIARQGRRHGALQAICQVRRRVLPLAYDELVDVSHIWVDTALSLGEADLRKMERLVTAQARRQAAIAAPPAQTRPRPALALVQPASAGVVA
jgi:DSF synthase